MPKCTRDDLLVVRWSTHYPTGSSAADRFRARLAALGPCNPDACLEWPGARDQHGYGSIGVGPDLTERTHRVAWMITNGDIPDGFDVLHSCDNPPCCNDRHLFVGTPQDNVDDMVRKGRNSMGGRVGSAKLTDDDVRLMRRLYAEWATMDELAARFGVGTVTVWRAVSGAGWAHVADVPPVRRPHRRGDRVRAAKFSDAQVAELRRRWQDGGVTQRALAKEYGINRTYLNEVLRGKERA